MTEPLTTLSSHMKEYYRSTEELLDTVQKVLDKYTDTEFWGYLEISRRRIPAGPFNVLVHQEPNKYYRTFSGDYLEFLPDKGARLNISGMYSYNVSHDFAKDERYRDLLRRIADDINKETVLERFLRKRFLEQNPDLTVS